VRRDRHVVELVPLVRLGRVAAARIGEVVAAANAADVIDDGDEPIDAGGAVAAEHKRRQVDAVERTVDLVLQLLAHRVQRAVAEALEVNDQQRRQLPQREHFGGAHVLALHLPQYHSSCADSRSGALNRLKQLDSEMCGSWRDSRASCTVLSSSTDEIADRL
jgi:hypothetical protein